MLNRTVQSSFDVLGCYVFLRLRRSWINFWRTSLPLLIDMNTWRTRKKYLISKSCLTRAQMKARQFYENTQFAYQSAETECVLWSNEFVFSLLVFTVSLPFYCLACQLPLWNTVSFEFVSWIIHEDWICFLTFCLPAAGLGPFQKCFCFEIGHFSSAQRHHGRLGMCKTGINGCAVTQFSLFSTTDNWFSGITSSKPKNDAF